jgi:signal transduction histidine kinase
LSGERSKSAELEVRQLLFKTIALYLALLAAEGALVGWLFFDQFDQRVIQRKLLEATDVAQILARRLSSQLGSSGAIDHLRVVERQDRLARMIDQHLARLKIVNSVVISTPDGRELMEVRRTSPGGAGKVTIKGEAFGGFAPPSPDSPPNLSLLQAGESYRLSSRSVQVPLEDGLGTLSLGVTSGAMEQEAARLRRELVLRLVVGGVVSVALLIVAFVYVLRLVHRTRRLERETQEAEKLAYIGTLASGLAHEIRNPLNAMNINLELLEEEIESGEIAEGSLALLRSSRDEVQRLEMLVKDFLAFARPQTRNREEVHPRKLVGDVLRFVRPEFEAKNIEIELVHEEGTPTISIDAAQLKQALYNIVRNAQEVSPAGSRVQVRIGATEQGEARIEILDQGPGIDPAIRERIFEVFWSKKPAGTGLGLPIAQRAVVSHGGRIEVESRSEGGSRFTIVLPPALSNQSGPVPETVGSS